MDVNKFPLQDINFDLFGQPKTLGGVFRHQPALLARVLPVMHADKGVAVGLVEALAAVLARAQALADCVNGAGGAGHALLPCYGQDSMRGAGGLATVICWPGFGVGHGGQPAGWGMAA